MNDPDTSGGQGRLLSNKLLGCNLCHDLFISLILFIILLNLFYLLLSQQNYHKISNNYYQ